MTNKKEKSSEVKEKSSEVKEKSSAVLEILKKNTGRKGGMRNKDRKYTIAYELENPESIILAPQAIQCVSLIYDTEKEEISEVELFNLFHKDAFETKQTPWKIFQYYRKSIVDAGILVEMKKDA